MNTGQELAKSSSIADRLALLKSNGENNWRKRVPKAEAPNDIKRESFISVRLIKFLWPLCLSDN
jgi:hypothetical protein